MIYWLSAPTDAVKWHFSCVLVMKEVGLWFAELVFVFLGLRPIFRSLNVTDGLPNVPESEPEFEPC